MALLSAMAAGDEHACVSPQSRRGMVRRLRVNFPELVRALDRRKGHVFSRLVEALSPAAAILAVGDAPATVVGRDAYQWLEEVVHKA